MNFLYLAFWPVSCIFPLNDYRGKEKRMSENNTDTAQHSAIVVENLTKSFGDLKAVNNISFTIEKGSTTALLGGNGAGKTTTLSMLLGVLYPTEGTISVLGKDMLHDRYAVLERMNFASPYADLPRKLTVRQNLLVYGRLYSVVKLDARIEELAKMFEIVDFIDKPFGKLSAGQQTRVALAKALLNTPDVLLLDEPTASLDPDMGDRIRSLVEQYRTESNATVLLASHNMQEVERLCDNVLMMRQGEIVDRGAPDALIDRYGMDNMEDVFLKVARDQDNEKTIQELQKKAKS